jgi:hypothetical protein
VHIFVFLAIHFYSKRQLKPVSYFFLLEKTGEGEKRGNKRRLERTAVLSR